MLQALLLIALGASCRLIPHFWPHDNWNLVPIGAIALFAGSRLPKRIAWSVPVFAMILSDIVMDQKYGGYFHAPNRWISYGTLALIALAGVYAKAPKAGIFRLAGLSLGGSILFFLTTNFGCWAWPEGTDYPATIAGLMQCYVAAIPFFRNTIIAELIGTALLFGLSPAVGRAWSRLIASTPPANANDLVAAGPSPTR